jgi:competence protein ComEA
MTILQSLAIKLIMLGITVGVIYWAVSIDDQQHSWSPEPLLMAETAAKLPAKLNEEAAVVDNPTPTNGRKVADLEESQARDDPGHETGRNLTVEAPVERVTSPPARRAKSLLASPARRPVKFPIDLNKGRRQDFLELPGIGEKLAERIVEYRKDHGRFQSIEDLRRVKGIGKKRMERLRPLVVTAGDHD